MNNTFQNAFQFNYNSNDKVEVWEYGDFLRKVSHFLPDSEEKWKIVCGISDVQSTEFTSPQAHDRALKTHANDLQKYLEERSNWNPFNIQ